MRDWLFGEEKLTCRNRLGERTTMTDEELAAIYRLLAAHHRNLAKEAVLDVVQQYHLDLARRLADEAALIPKRTAISERLRDREQQSTEKPGDDDGGV